MKITYQIEKKNACGISRKEFTHENVAYWQDEPDAIGGVLRVMYDKAGRMIAGPSLDEIREWDGQS